MDHLGNVRREGHHAYSGGETGFAGVCKDAVMLLAISYAIPPPGFV
jgi:hypothetical protein